MNRLGTSKILKSSSLGKIKSSSGSKLGGMLRSNATYKTARAIDNTIGNITNATAPIFMAMGQPELAAAELGASAVSHGVVGALKASRGDKKGAIKSALEASKKTTGVINASKKFY